MYWRDIKRGVLGLDKLHGEITDPCYATRVDGNQDDSVLGHLNRLELPEKCLCNHNHINITWLIYRVTLFMSLVTSTLEHNRAILQTDTRA